MQAQTIEAETSRRAMTVGAIPASAAVTALAGALIVLGSVGTWGRIGDSGQGDPILRGTVGGLALAEGKLTLALGLVVAAAAGALFLRSKEWRRVLLPIVLLASVAVGTIATVDTIRAEERFPAARLDDVARNISDTTGFPFDPIRARLASQVAGPAEVTPDIGMVLVLAGAALGTGASAVTVARSRRRSARAG